MMEVDSLDAASLTSGGYDVDISHEDKMGIEKYKCAVCRKILKNAMQLPDLDVPSRACYTCYTAIPSNEGSAAAFPDKATDNEIANLKVNCPNKNNGCLWSNQLKYLQKHQSQCMYRSHYCYNCKQWVVLNKHEDNCPEMPQACLQCYKMVMRKNLEDHLQHFCQWVEQCNCGENIVLSEEPDRILHHWKHRKKCLYSYLGCEIDGLHEGESHDALLVSNFLKLNRIIITLRQKVEEQYIKLKQLEIKSFEKETAFREQINELRESVKSLQKENAKLKEQFTQTQFPIPDGGARLKKQVNVVSYKVTDMEIKNLEVSKTLRDIDNGTVNGKLVWKIDELDLRMAQAKSEKLTVLHSAPCYTKQYEYKYCVRLCLYGDGIGRASHISIFFIVMKSEFDELLSWPIEKRVKIELINLRNKAHSVIEKSESLNFHRPTKNMDVALSYPLFISIERFLNEGFIKDNSVFIKVSVKDA